MREFNLKSGAIVQISDTKIKIIRKDGKSAVKSLFAGRTMGEMVIKLSSVTGIIQNDDYLLICASGMPTPNDFKITNIAEIKQCPNCIVGKPDELQEVFSYLSDMI